MKTIAENRFGAARKRLSNALKNLEEAMKEKLHEAALEKKMIDVSDENSEAYEAKMVEQSTIIQNLHIEINNLQKNLEDLGKENEFLNTKNKVFAERISDLRTQGANLAEAMGSELAQIEQLIKGED